MAVKRTQRARKPKLHLVSAEGQHYIQVPTSHASALVVYLRTNGIRAAPPEPCDAHSETVSILGTVDPPVIQRLIKGWR
jgi:hypothetical protein